MNINFRNNKLQKCANQKSTAQKELGAERAKKYLARLNDMRDAICLEDLRHLPQAKFHALKADRHGQFACALDHPYRLIFSPNHDPLPLLPDGGLSWSQITAITILEIVDYH